MKRYSQQRGYLLILAVILIVIIGFIGAVSVYLFINNSRASSDYYQSTQAFYLAESGAENAFHAIVPAGASSSCQSTSITNASAGAGVYTVSGTVYAANPTTTLSSALTATATSISVASTSGYSSTGGLLLIDKEIVSYANVTGNTFVQVTRGAYSSTATTHSVGTAIGQYQCNLTSTGGVSNLNTPSNPGDPLGKRVLTVPLALQDGWIVGSNFNQNWGLARWNNPILKQWNSAVISAANATNLYAIDLISYIDGWAVGQAQSNNLLMLHWNGSSWSRVLPNATVNADLNGVFCNKGDDCWAVGAFQGNSPVVERWQGSSLGWSRSSAPNVSASLNSVACNSSTDCWAVGTQVNNDPIIFRWNGTSWSRWATMPTPAARANLNSIACNSSSDCWAVGNNSTTTGAALIMHWNGSSWSRTTPTPVTAASLNGISCGDSSNCWAVGNAGGSAMYVVRYNGSTWAQTTVPVSGNFSLYDIKCITSADCWMVGSNGFILHWDGGVWTSYAVQGYFPNQILYAVDALGIGTPSLQSIWKELF